MSKIKGSTFEQSRGDDVTTRNYVVHSEGLIHIRGRDNNIEAGADHVSEDGVAVDGDDLTIYNTKSLIELQLSVDASLSVIKRGELSK